MDKRFKVYTLVAAIAILPLLIAYITASLLGNLSLVPQIYLGAIVLIWILWKVSKRRK